MSSTFSMLLGLATLAATGNLLSNGDFEKGIQGWSTGHAWYAQPQGGGLSEIVVADGEGRGGSKALRIIGQGKRGLAMQILPVYPGRYLVTGWVRCEGLEAGDAGVLCEWMTKDSRWMRGDRAVTVQGTRDWTAFDTTVEAPEGARSVHLDLLTSSPNNGTVWFDDLTFSRVPSGLGKPQPPKLAVATPPGAESCLELRWDPAKLSPGPVRLLVYCEEQPLSRVSDLVPRAVLDAADGSGRVPSLEVGRSYQVAARLVNADSEVSELGAEATAKVLDRQGPRPGWLAAERSAKGVRLTWSPHVLDLDVRRLSICLPGQGDQPGKPLKTIDVATLCAEPRPLYCTAPWVSLEVEAAASVGKLGVWAEDKSGNRGPVGWVDIQAALPTTELTHCALLSVPPTRNVPRNMGPPAAVDRGFELRLMRGQAKGYQVVLIPERDLHGVRVNFAGPVHEDGKTRIDPRWLAYHFVNYVRLEKNSIATPAEELVWSGPADYPDELSDDLTRDLKGGETQPVFIRVTAPRDAKPGKYTGRGSVECAEGRREFGFTLQVEPVALPDPVRMPFVYWYSWDEPCKRLGVEQYSADGWRTLYQLGRLMRAHHQRVVVISYAMIRTWRDAEGKLHNDFRDFDRYLRTFQAAGVNQLFCLSHIGSRTTGEWGSPTFSSHGHAVTDLATGDPVPQMDVVDLLPAIQDHIEKLGLLDRFVVHVADEPITVNRDSYRELSARVRQAAPKLRRIDAIHIPDLDGSLEVWVPQLNYFEQWLPQFREAQQAGNEVWFYIAWVPQGKFPNRMIDSSALKPRVLHWLNALYDTDGYLHWALNWWGIPLTSLDSPGDQYIVWPSTRFVANSSLRYEAEREGLEDCELMLMVRERLMKQGLSRATAQARMAGIGRQAVRSGQDYTRSWEELEAARGELLRRLTSR